MRTFMLTCLLAAVPAFAQTDRGTITGTVQDPASSTVPGAAVVAKNVANGPLFPTTTNVYRQLHTGLAAGGRVRTICRSGRIQEICQPRRGGRSGAGHSPGLSLLIGAATDSVTLNASAPLLKPDSVEQSVNFTGDRINSLPLDFGSTSGAVGGIRTVLSFMTLAPGVGGEDTNARVNGQLGGTYRIFVDGQDVSNNNSPTSTAGQPSVEMVEEFSLQTSNFAAEYGQVAGGMFTFAMRSGTNKFHGSLYEYFTNERPDASPANARCSSWDAFSFKVLNQFEN